MSTQRPSTGPGPHRDPGQGGRPIRRGRRLNLRAAAILATLLLVGIPGFFLVARYQERRRGDALLAQARTLLDRKPPEPNLALSYLDRYLEIGSKASPAYLDALDLKAKTLFGMAHNDDTLGMIRAPHEQLIRLDTGNRFPEARRRLAQLLLAGQNAQNPQAALVLLEGLTDRGKSKPTAEDFRLLSVAIQYAAPPEDPEALARATVAAEEAQRLDPGSVQIVGILAGLHLNNKNPKHDPAKADRALELLLEKPLSEADRGAAHFIRYEFLMRTGETNRARADLREARRLQPQNPEYWEAAVRGAIQRGDLNEARALLDDRPSRLLTEEHYLFLGEADAYLNQTERALADWREGLVATGGTSQILTYRLAAYLLELGRVDEAAPLIAQYQRLSDTDQSKTRAVLLEAMLDLKRNKAAEALVKLEEIRPRAGDVEKDARGNPIFKKAPEARELEANVIMTMGQCYEALGKVDEALNAYREAAQAATTEAVAANSTPVRAWRSAAEVLVRSGRLDDAAAELNTALSAVGNQPSLLAALVQVRIAQQARVPKDRQSWAEVERDLERGLKAFPSDPALIKLQAAYLATTGRTDEAKALLDAATDPSRRPRDPDLYLSQAELLRREGKVREALAVLDRGTETVGELASLRAARAQLLLAQGHEKAALDVLTEGANLVPADQRPTLWRALGDLQRRLNDPAAARRAYTRWAELNPEDTQPRFHLLDLALADGDQAAMAEAVAALEKSGGIAPLIAKAAVLMDARRPAGGDEGDAKARRDEAGRVIGEIVAREPTNPVGYLLRGRLLERQGDLEGAAEAYGEARGHKGGPEALRAEVSALARAGKFADLQRLREELGPGEMTTELEQLIAGAALAQGKTAEAEQIARQVVAGDPEGLNARVWQAGVLREMGKPEEAEKSLRALVDQQPDQLTPRFALMMFYSSLGRKAEAAAIVEQIKSRVEPDRAALVLASCYQAIGDRDKAAASYREALRARPGDPDATRRAAGFFKAAGLNDDAIKALREAVEADPGQDWARRDLAVLLSARAGDEAAWAEALELIGASARPGDTPEDRLVRATVLARSSDPARRQLAIGILEGLIAEGSGAVVAGSHDLLSRVHDDAGRLPEALEHAEASVASGNNDPGAIAHLVELLVRSKKPDEAGSQLDRLAQLEGESLRVLNLRSMVLQVQGRSEEATAQLEKALKALPDGPGSEATARGILDLIARLDRPDVTERVARDLARRWPTGAWSLGLVLGRAGRIDEALKACQDAATAGAIPEAALAAAQLTSSLPEGPEAKARLARADGLLEAALKRRPEDVALLFARAVVQRGLGRHDRAVEHYRALLARQPDNLAALNNLAWTLSEDLGRPQEALDPIDRAIRLSNSPSLLDTRGVILTRLNRLDDAIRDLESATRSGPSPTTYYHLARAYHKAGKSEEFRSTRDRALKAGLVAEQLQPNERAELKQLLE